MEGTITLLIEKSKNKKANKKKAKRHSLSQKFQYRRKFDPSF